MSNKVGLTAKQRQAKLDAIAEQISRCRVCKRGKIGVAVPGEGSPGAEIVFLGEAPGKEEAKTGRPFIGRAGKILRALIKETGLNETDVYITSPVKYLPKYVTPTRADIAHGRKHLQEQLNVIQPKFVVLLGNTAALAMLERKISVSKDHGSVIEENGKKYFLTYHPAAPLHSPSTRAKLVDDFKKLKQYLQNNNR